MVKNCFHLREGFYYGRKGDEIVIGHFHGEDGKGDQVIHVPLAEWASAVAHTVAHGGNSKTYQKALDLLGKEVD